jgi:uncharacterized membrane protein
VNAIRGKDLLPGLMLGMGLGGFVDGIVLHQVLQWHHMLTSEGCCPERTVAGLEDNTLADGLFHMFAWVLVAVGIALLWRRAREGVRPDGRRLAGLALAGWGIFNLVEGIIDHQILGIHHVKAGDAEWAFDAGFLVLGAGLLAGGLTLARARA